MPYPLISVRLTDETLANVDLIVGRKGGERSDFVRSAIARAVSSEFTRMAQAAGREVPVAADEGATLDTPSRSTSSASAQGTAQLAGPGSRHDVLPAV